MSQSSERLVFFVTPAQKRVLAARAERLGISLSELVRRAVLAFDETGAEVRAAGLVDRLGAERSQIADSDRLRRLAAGARAEPGQTGRTRSARDTTRDTAPEAASVAPRTAAADTTATSAGSTGQAPANPATSSQDDGSDEAASSPLPVAAAVARALASEAVARSGGRPDGDDEAAVARVIANESGDLSRF